MSTDSWEAQNNRYLAASLRWLRLRLQRLVPTMPAPAPPPMPVAGEPAPPRAAPRSVGTASTIKLPRWLGGTPPADAAGSAPGPAVRETPLLVQGTPVPLEELITEAEKQRDADAAIDPPPALVLLANRLGLSAFERDTFLLAAAPEFDPSLSVLFASVEGNPGASHPTFGLALSLFDDPAWDVLAAHRPLRYGHLIEVAQTGAAPLTSSPIRADERMVNFLKGLNVMDDRLSAILVPVDQGTALAAPSQRGLAASILTRLHASTTEATVPLVQLTGADAGSKLTVARHVCDALERQLLRAPVEVLPSQVSELELLGRLWQRETLLLNVALYLDADQRDLTPGSDVVAVLARFAARQTGLAFLSVRDAPVRLPSPTFTVDVRRPTAAEQNAAWVSALGPAGGDAGIGTAADALAGQFDLNLQDIQRAAALALPEGQGTLEARAWDAARNLIRPRFDALAQQLDVKMTWHDLVLPDEPLGLLRQMAGQVRERHRVYEAWGFGARMNRGFGISALLAGESGTGKTMAAEVIANDLRLSLYRIDLSGVVSKYIGETEKNLSRVFDAAEQGGCVLLFDEADALFGKRSEVKDSHDRYANVEINYLLQRMEAFTGLAILATNMKTALDPAFMRRLRFIVQFPFPGAKERKQIWERAFPSLTPCAELDFSRLARLNLTGGNIHSVAINAAFMAAQDGQRVTMPIVLAAARMEMRKLEQPFSEAEFR